MKKILISVLILSISISLLYSEDSNNKKKIKLIRKEFQKINKTPLNKISYFFDKEQSEWKEGKNNKVESNVTIFLDKKGRVRKYVEISNTGFTYTKREEYFWQNGELFFVFLYGEAYYHQQEVRLYFWKSKIIKNLSKEIFNDTSDKEKVKTGKYLSPNKLGYHKTTSEIIKKFNIDNELELEKAKIIKLVNDIISKNSEKVAQSKQMILVISPKLRYHKAKVYTFNKVNGNWQTAFQPITSTIGKKGFAKMNKKIEDDLKSPTGIFSLDFVFGYTSSFNTQMLYRQCTVNDYWIDDVNSDLYNSWITVADGKPDAKSFERMKRKDHLYKYGIVVKYNMNPVVKGRGSGMFFHVWRRAGAPTAGCVGMSEENITKIMSWLDPAKKPIVILGTEAILRSNKLSNAK